MDKCVVKENGPPIKARPSVLGVDSDGLFKELLYTDNAAMPPVTDNNEYFKYLEDQFIYPRISMADLTSQFPKPPAHYKDCGTMPPPCPTEDYVVFGRTRFIQSTREPTSMAESKLELKALTKKILSSYIKLVVNMDDKGADKDINEAIARIDTILCSTRVLEARCNLICLLRQQIDEKKNVLAQLLPINLTEN